MRATISPPIDDEDRGDAGEWRKTKADEQHRPAAEPVGQRAEHKLGDRKPQQIERDRELHGRRVGREFATMPGIAGTRMLSDTGPMAVIAISSASRLQGAARGAPPASPEGAHRRGDPGVHGRPSGRVAAASQSRVAASTSGASVSRDARMIAVEPDALLRRSACGHRSAAGRSAPASASRSR